MEIIMYSIKLFMLFLSWKITEGSKFKGCKDNGEILPHPTDQCSYIVCSYAASYNGHYGNTILPVPRRCAPGTSVDTFEFDPYNPCSVTSDYCKSEFEITYIGKDPYDVDAENDVTDKNKIEIIGKNGNDLYKRQGQINDIVEEKDRVKAVYEDIGDLRQDRTNVEDKNRVKAVYEDTGDLREGRSRRRRNRYTAEKYDDKYRKYKDFPKDEVEREVYYPQPHKKDSSRNRHVTHEEFPKESERYGETETEVTSSRSRSRQKQRRHTEEYPKVRESYREKASEANYRNPKHRDNIFKPLWEKFRYDQIDIGKGEGDRALITKGRNGYEESDRSKDSQKDNEYEKEKTFTKQVKYDPVKISNDKEERDTRYSQKNLHITRKPTYSNDDIHRYTYYPNKQDKTKYVRVYKSEDTRPEKARNGLDHNNENRGNYNRKDSRNRDKWERSVKLHSDVLPKSFRYEEPQEYKEPGRYRAVEYNKRNHERKLSSDDDRYQRNERNRHRTSYEPATKHDVNKYQTYNGY